MRIGVDWLETFFFIVLGMALGRAELGGVFVLLMISHSFEDLGCDTDRSGIDLCSVGEGVLLVSWPGLDSVFRYDTLSNGLQWDRESAADEALFGIDSIWQLAKKEQSCVSLHEYDLLFFFYQPENTLTAYS